MSNVLSDQWASANSSKRQKRLMSVILWTIQGVLALLFLLSGAMKLILPIQTWIAMMPVPLPGLFIRFIGVIEVAGALGLILPGLTRIKPFLTPLTACGLVLEMIGATTATVIGLGVGPALFLPLIVGLLAVFVAYGRRPSRRSA